MREGGRAGQHRQRKKPGADDAEREEREGESARRVGRSASAACDEVWISVMPCACSVAAAVSMMNSATRLESPIPT